MNTIAKKGFLNLVNSADVSLCYVSSVNAVGIKTEITYPEPAQYYTVFLLCFEANQDPVPYVEVTKQHWTDAVQNCFDNRNTDNLVVFGAYESIEQQVVHAGNDGDLKYGFEKPVIHPTNN